MFETRGERQAEFIKLIKEKDIVFGFGPAGTGKSFLAANIGSEFLLSKKMQYIVYTKPCVQVDGDWGFLPGDMKEKSAPYKQVLDEFFQESLDDKYQKFEHEGKIKFEPLEFMRSKTFNNTFCILDEAQNCTINQMKMFLTRLGKESKMVILGDLKQCDLEHLVLNGLSDALRRFNTPQWKNEIGITKFKIDDIQRHDLVGKIIREYDGE